MVSFEDSDDTYGYRRVHADLAAWGIACGPELVRALMRELGLEPCQPRPWRHSLTEQDGHTHPIPDLVNRDFTADAPRPFQDRLRSSAAGLGDAQVVTN